MSVYLRNGHWWYDFHEDGERYRRPCGDGVKTKTHALKVEALKRAMARNGELDAKRAPILRDFAVEFLAWVDANEHYTENGRKRYHYGISLFRGTKVWTMRLSSITASVVATADALRRGVRKAQSRIGAQASDEARQCWRMPPLQPDVPATCAAYGLQA